MSLIYLKKKKKLISEIRYYAGHFYYTAAGYVYYAGHVYKSKSKVGMNSHNQTNYMRNCQVKTRFTATYCCLHCLHHHSLHQDNHLLLPTPTPSVSISHSILARFPTVPSSSFLSL